MNAECELGMVGLGVMGRNMLLNMAAHHLKVAGYDRDAEKISALRGSDIQAFGTVADFMGSLKRPCLVMMLVPAGAPVDAVIGDLLPYLAEGDCVIDGGNSFFKDTERRQRMLGGQGIDFLGVGVSGGEEGALHGPSLMPGGPQRAWERIRAVFEAIAANVHGEPCVRYMGQGAAGHFVKMVHNGIEYATMQMIAEAYDLMKRGMGLPPHEIAATFEHWNEGELRGFLVEITARILRKKEAASNQPLVDAILDVASQKGTGAWTSQTARDLHVPVPCIDAAVSMRDLSVLKSERSAASALFPGVGAASKLEKGDVFLQHLSRALYAGMEIAFAQGMALLHVASGVYKFGLDLEAIASVWRGGCIIRSALLEPIAAVFRRRPDLPNLLLDASIAAKIASRESDLRFVVTAAAARGIPAPGLMAALGYYDAYRSAWLPANLIEAQRDFFGAHGYQRKNENGTFHTEWSHD